MKQLLSATLAIAPLACSAQIASAGVTSPVISGSYYEQNGTASCTKYSAGGGVVCQLLLAAPPAGKQVLLERTACHLRVDTSPSGAALKDIYLAQNINGSISRTQFLAADLHGQDAAGISDYTVSESLNGGYLVVAPVRIVMDLTAVAVNFSLDCQITGTLRSTPAP